MAHSDDRSPSKNILSGEPPRAPSALPPRQLSFLPDDSLTEDRARALLKEGTPEERARLVSQIVSFAPWDEIWTYLTPDELRRLLPELDLPPSLAAAWRRYLDR